MSRRNLHRNGSQYSESGSSTAPPGPASSNAHALPTRKGLRRAEAAQPGPSRRRDHDHTAASTSASSYHDTDHRDPPSQDAQHTTHSGPAQGKPDSPRGVPVYFDSTAANGRRVIVSEGEGVLCHEHMPAPRSIVGMISTTEVAERESLNRTVPLQSGAAEWSPVRSRTPPQNAVLQLSHDQRLSKALAALAQLHQCGDLSDEEYSLSKWRVINGESEHPSLSDAHGRTVYADDTVNINDHGLTALLDDMSTTRGASVAQRASPRAGSPNSYYRTYSSGSPTSNSGGGGAYDFPEERARQEHQVSALIDENTGLRQMTEDLKRRLAPRGVSSAYSNNERSGSTHPQPQPSALRTTSPHDTYSSTRGKSASTAISSRQPSRTQSPWEPPPPPPPAQESTPALSLRHQIKLGQGGGRGRPLTSHTPTTNAKDVKTNNDTTDPWGTEDAAYAAKVLGGTSNKQGSGAAPPPVTNTPNTAVGGMRRAPQSLRLGGKPQQQQQQQGIETTGLASLSKPPQGGGGGGVPQEPTKGAGMGARSGRNPSADRRSMGRICSPTRETADLTGEWSLNAFNSPLR